MPIVCTEARADAFKLHHAEVSITAPFHEAVPEHWIVILVDDLPLFTQTWYYSALSYPMLNNRLSTTFTLRDPAHDASDPHSEPREIPIPLQRKLLLPFELVKGLHGAHFHNYAPLVQSELVRLQNKPIPSLQEAVETAADFLATGDSHLSSSPPRPTLALELYRKAFHSIHILIYGRTRRVLGDGFFHDSICKGRYAGQTGITVRIHLRLKLVSRTILAYLMLSEYGDAAHWGMRSINIVGEALDNGFDEFLTDVTGIVDVGFIHLRSAIAFWKMERDKENWFGELISFADEPRARSDELWGMAKRFLRGRKHEAMKELKEHGISQDIVEMFGEEDRIEHDNAVADER